MYSIGNRENQLHLINEMLAMNERNEMVDVLLSSFLWRSGISRYLIKLSDGRLGDSLILFIKGCLLENLKPHLAKEAR